MLEDGWLLILEFQNEVFESEGVSKISQKFLLKTENLGGWNINLSINHQN